MPAQSGLGSHHRKSKKKTGAVNSLSLNAQSAVLVNNDPENMSHLSEKERFAIASMQAEIGHLHRQLFHQRHPSAIDEQPGFELFQNKHFNKLRLKFVNLNAKEIRAQLRRVWMEVLSHDER